MTTDTRDSSQLQAAEAIIEDARALNAVVQELQRARDKFRGTFASAHEGYAVILEEIDELKAEVFKKREHRSVERLRNEAIQVAAMAVRFASDVCHDTK